VHDALDPGARHGVDGLQEDVRRHGDRERAATCRHHLVEVRPGDVLHGHEGSAVRQAADLVDPGDVVALDLRRRARLGNEARDGVLRGGAPVEDHDGDGPPLRVVREQGHAERTALGDALHRVAVTDDVSRSGKAPRGGRGYCLHALSPLLIEEGTGFSPWTTFGSPCRVIYAAGSGDIAANLCEIDRP